MTSDGLKEKIEKLQSEVVILVRYWTPDQIHYLEGLIKLSKKAESILKEYNNSAI